MKVINSLLLFATRLSAVKLVFNTSLSVFDKMGATFRNPYDGRLRNLLTEINLALVGGVNQMKLHTSTFRYGENSFWPGCNIHYSSLPDFNDTQPFWSEMDLICGAINRGQLVVRRGEAKRDLLVYLRRFNEPEGNTDDLHHLLKYGYTYDYYNAEMLELLPKAADGVIAPEKAGFKAIVVEESLLCRDGRMPTRAAKAILSQAKAGVPVVVQGKIPTKTEGLHDSDEELKSLWDEIAATEKFVQVTTVDEVPEALKKLGVRPNLEPEKTGGFASWCSDEEGVRAYLVLNQGRTYYRAYPQKENYVGKVSLKGQGGLYRVAPWTGETTPVPYTREGEYVTFDLDLKSWEEAIFLLFGEEHKLPLCEKTYGETIALDRWELQVESWTPAHPYGTSAETPEGCETKKELLSPVLLTELKPWKDIPGLDKSLSGVGYYTTDFLWDGTYHGAVLDLGETYDTARVFVNGQEAILDQLSLRVDISPYLKVGENTLTVRCTTGLCNVLYAMNAIPCELGYSDFGLLGPVQLIPYK